MKRRKGRGSDGFKTSQNQSHLGFLPQHGCEIASRSQFGLHVRTEKLSAQPLLASRHRGF
jgi:hypothetical protein